MNKRIKELENEIDRQEKYSRRNCILIHWIAENKQENTDQRAIDFLNDNLLKPIRSTLINTIG